MTNEMIAFYLKNLRRSLRSLVLIDLGRLETPEMRGRK
jgi:hypothetical protein